MKPASWTEALVGICCLLVPLWLVPEVLLGLFRSPYGQPSITSIVGYAGLISGFLLFGSIGMSLLTDEYHKHRKAFHRIWLFVGIFAAMSILWTWIAFSGVR